MALIVGFVLLFSFVGLVGGFIGLFRKKSRSKAARTAGVSLIVFIAAAVFMTKAENSAKTVGFASYAEQSDAAFLGIADPARWAKHKETLAKEAAQREVDAKAAGFDSYTQQQYARASGVTSGADWQKRPLAKKQAEVLARTSGTQPTPVSASSDTGYPLAGKITDFVKDFNTAAILMKAPTRFIKAECQSRPTSEMCQYTAGDAFRVVLTTTLNGSNRTEMATIIFTGDQLKAPEFTLNLVVMMSMYAPDSTSEERWDVVKAILNALKENRTETSIPLRGLRIDMNAGMGVWVHFLDARNKGNDSPPTQSPPSAASYPLLGNITDFAKDFNATSKQIGLPDERFKKLSCKAEVNAVCEYTAANEALRVLATAIPANKNRTDHIVMIYGGGNDKLMKLPLYVGFLVAMYVPDATKNERGDVALALMEGLQKTPVGSEATLRGIRFSLTGVEKMGIFISVSDTRNPWKGYR